MKNKKYIEPCYMYDTDNNPVEAYLSIDDYEAFMNKLKLFSENMQKLNKQEKKKAPKKITVAKIIGKKKI